METWYTIHLGEPIDNLIADAALGLLDEIFAVEFAHAGGPPDMAIFKRLESENRLHCDLVLYFSPAAREAADWVDAEPCEKPARAGLYLLAGNAEAWSLLFPEGG